MPAYSPFPWQNDRAYGAYYITPHVIRHNGLVIAARGRDATDADMELLAKAPALLSALEAMMLRRPEYVRSPSGDPECAYCGRSDYQSADIVHADECPIVLRNYLKAVAQ